MAVSVAAHRACPEVKAAIKVLNKNIASLGLAPEIYVIKKIKDSIDRYIYCFNLYGTTPALIKAAKA